jgi:hypothetical protein
MEQSDLYGVRINKNLLICSNGVARGETSLYIEGNFRLHFTALIQPRHWFLSRGIQMQSFLFVNIHLHVPITLWSTKVVSFS